MTTLKNHILKKSGGKNQREESFEIWRRREWDSSCSEFPFKVSHPSTKLYLLHFYNIMCFINVFQSFFLYEMLVWNCKDEFPIEKKNIYIVQVSRSFFDQPFINTSSIPIFLKKFFISTSFVWKLSSAGPEFLKPGRNCSWQEVIGSKQHWSPS